MGVTPKIIKVKYFDGLTIQTYEVGKNGVIEIDPLENVKVVTKDFDGKKYIYIKSSYVELFTD